MRTSVKIGVLLAGLLLAVTSIFVLQACLDAEIQGVIHPPEWIPFFTLALGGVVAVAAAISLKDREDREA